MFIGDIISQVVALLIPTLVILMIVFFTRSSNKRKKQLDTIEEKLDTVLKQSSKK